MTAYKPAMSRLICKGKVPNRNLFRRKTVESLLSIAKVGRRMGGSGTRMEELSIPYGAIVELV